MSFSFPFDRTLIQEGTYFPQILGTSDYASGEEACMELAITNPEEALGNAENLAYFAIYA